jgi:glycogen synthase
MFFKGCNCYKNVQSVLIIHNLLKYQGLIPYIYISLKSMKKTPIIDYIHL